MSFPIIKKEPSYMKTQLNELKEYMKSIEPNKKSSSPRKSPKKESPISSKNVKSLLKLQTIEQNK